MVEINTSSAIGSTTVETVMAAKEHVTGHVNGKSDKTLGGPIDPEEHLSKLSKGRQPNELRSLAPMFKLPGIKWLAGGLPSPDNFPITSFSFTLASGEKVTIDDPKMVSDSQQYCLDAYGHTKLRAWVEKQVETLHNPPNSEWKVCLTCGNSDAIDKVLSPANDSSCVSRTHLWRVCANAR